MINQFQSSWAGHQIHAIAGIDARGFIIGGALAYKMNLPFVALRKKGKLPYETISEEYDLEYGKATLEIHKDAIKPGANVLVVDDLIATGGTAVAGINLIRALEAPFQDVASLLICQKFGAEKTQIDRSRSEIAFGV